MAEFSFDKRLRSAFQSPLFHLGVGILGQNGVIGKGIQSGMGSYQSFLANDVNYRSAQFKLDAAREARERLSFLASPEGREQLSEQGVPAFLAQYAPEVAAQLAADLIGGREKPLKRYDSTDYGVLDTISGELRPFHPGGGGTGFFPHPALKGYDPDGYQPASWVEANRTGDPTRLRRNVPQRTPEGPPSTAENLLMAKYGDEKLKVYSTIRNSGEMIYSLLSDPEAGGPEQLAGLISFAKVLDPDSVVREGEVALQREAGGVRAMLEAMSDKLKAQGGLLGEGQRVSIMRATKKLLDIAERERKSKLAKLDRQVTAGGYNRELALPSAGPFPEMPKWVAAAIEKENAERAAAKARAAQPAAPLPPSPALDNAMDRYSAPPPGQSGPAMDSFGRPVAPAGDAFFPR